MDDLSQCCGGDAQTQMEQNLDMLPPPTSLPLAASQCHSDAAVFPGAGAGVERLRWDPTPGIEQQVNN